jgi:hypothetical protein
MSNGNTLHWLKFIETVFNKFLRFYPSRTVRIKVLRVQGCRIFHNGNALLLHYGKVLFAVSYGLIHPHSEPYLPCNWLVLRIFV